MSAKANRPPPSVPPNPIVYSEDRTGAESAARYNHPEYFALATPADAEALIAAVAAHSSYLHAALWPRREIARACKQWEQEYVRRRDRVRACPTYQRVSPATRERIEAVAFCVPELPSVAKRPPG